MKNSDELPHYKFVEVNAHRRARSYRDHNYEFEMRRMRVERPVERHSTGTDRNTRDFTRESGYRDQRSLNQFSPP